VACCVWWRCRGQAELGIDGEFTRPGLLHMLEQFKSDVEDIEQDQGEEISFVFQPRNEAEHQQPQSSSESVPQRQSATAQSSVRSHTCRCLPSPRACSEWRPCMCGCPYGCGGRSWDRETMKT
jgi:hypothetical protein